MNKVIAVILLSVGIFLLVERTNLTNETERRNDNLIENSETMLCIYILMHPLNKMFGKSY